MSLNTDDIDDIKQLIVANNQVLLDEFDQRMDQKFKTELAPIKQQLTDLTDFVTEAIDTSNDTAGKQLANHEERITNLERAAA
jgi:hypothetical protein